MKPGSYYRLLFGRVVLAATLILISGTSATVAENTASGGMDVIKSRILEPLLSSGASAADEASRLARSMNPDGGWPDIDYADSTRSGWKLSAHLSRLTVLASAYCSPLSPLRGDKDTGDAVNRALDFWLIRDFQNSNWWWNVIGVPRSLGPALLMIEDKLTPEQRAKGIEILERGKLGMTGQNLVWVALITLNRGLLEHDADLIRSAVASITDEIRVSEGEGIQADWSFYQHGDLLYSHGYGSGFASDCSRIATVLAGTAFAFPREKTDLLARLILDGHQWMMRGAMTDYGSRGREITRRGIDGVYMAGVAANMLKLPTGRDSEFHDLRERTLAGEPPLTGNRHFWRSDFMAHHRREYYSSARMYSSRVFNTDGPSNDEGIRSHHIADGCNLIFRTGREYFDIFPVWDWQRIPGATVVLTPGLSGDLRRKGETSFAGGVSDGVYGAAGFDFVRYDLSARKSWFFFDGGFVCLGAGISCGSEHPVVTTVNQCLLDGDVAVMDGAGRRSLEPGGRNLRNVKQVAHGGFVYIFPDGGDIYLKNDINTGSWHTISLSQSDDEIRTPVFTLGIDHGARPRDGSYAYIVAPDTIGGWIGHCPAVIVRNDPAVQCAADPSAGVAGIVMYEPSRVELPDGLTVGADMPCMLLVRETPDGGLAVSVSNPVNEPATVTVSIGRALKGNGAVPEAGGGTVAEFVLPGGLHAGSSVTKVFARR